MRNGEVWATLYFRIPHSPFRIHHMLGQAGLMTHIHKPDLGRPKASPKDRPMSPAAALRMLHDVQIGDILLTTVDDRTLRLRRVARPNAEQAELLAGLKLTLPERLCADCDVTDAKAFGLPTDAGKVAPPAVAEAAEVNERPVEPWDGVRRTC